MNRNTAIDSVRGIALSMVVLSHAMEMSHYLTDFYIVAFFFLSGYLYKPGRTWGENITRKAKRVLLPYFANSFILLAVAWAYRSFPAEYLQKALTGILYSRFRILPEGEAIMVSWNFPMWYLTSFFTASLLFHAIVDNAVKTRKATVWVSVLLVAASCAMTQLPVLLPWSLDLVPLATFVMMMGYLFRKNACDFRFRDVVVLGLVAVYVALCYWNGAVNLSVRDLGLMGGLVVSVAGICMSLALLSVLGYRRLQPVRNLFVPVGTNSIIVLAYHPFFLYVFRFIVQRVMPGADDNVFISALCAVLSVAVCVTKGTFWERYRHW